eukprot:221406-Prymnesium_polylepis.1
MPVRVTTRSPALLTHRTHQAHLSRERSHLLLAQPNLPAQPAPRELALPRKRHTAHAAQRPACPHVRPSRIAIILDGHDDEQEA